MFFDSKSDKHMKRGIFLNFKKKFKKTLLKRKIDPLSISAILWPPKIQKMGFCTQPILFVIALKTPILLPQCVSISPNRLLGRSIVQKIGAQTLILQVRRRAKKILPTIYRARKSEAMCFLWTVATATHTQVCWHFLIFKLSNVLLKLLHRHRRSRVEIIENPMCIVVQ